MERAITAILVVLFFGCAGTLRLPENSTVAESWSTPRGDCSNWASARSAGGDLVELWRADLKVPILATPVAGDGAIFVGTPIKRVFAFDAICGTKLGKIWVDIPIEDGLAYEDSFLVMTGRSIYNKLRCFDLRTGSFLWDKKSERAAAAPIVCGERVFYSTSSGALFALNLKTGEKIWRQKLREAVIEHEPGFRDSLLFVADKNGKLYCFDADSGAIMWELELPEAPIGPPVVIPDHVIAPTHSGRIPVITFDGRIRIEIEAPGEMIAPVVCSGPTIFGVTCKGIAFAGDLGSGGILWQTAVGEPVIVPPVLWGLEIVTITASGKMILLHYGTGEILDELDLDTPISASPIVYDSKLYVVTEGGELIAIGRAETEMEIQHEQ